MRLKTTNGTSEKLCIEQIVDSLIDKSRMRSIREILSLPLPIPTTYADPSDPTKYRSTIDLDSPRCEPWLFSETVYMPLSLYFSAALFKKEPTVSFDECTHNFSHEELAQIIDVDEMGCSTDIYDHLVHIHRKHLWSPTRVYFINCDDDQYSVQSAPRNPG